MLDGKVGPQVFFTDGSWPHLLAQLDQDIDLVGRDAFNRLRIVLGEVVRVQNACCGEALDVGLFGLHFRLLGLAVASGR